jgi:hypothetical protein
VAESANLPAELLASVRAVCLRLPEAHEEPAWVGIRWRVGKRTFAHLLAIESGWPPAYARAAATDGPVRVLTFRSPSPERDALCNMGHPFFKPAWGPDVMGMMLDGGGHQDTDRDVDWDEVAELITESYCLLAPRRLVSLVDRPHD